METNISPVRDARRTVIEAEPEGSFLSIVFEGELVYRPR